MMLFCITLMDDNEDDRELIMKVIINEIMVITCQETGRCEVFTELY